ncbi:hypothetical protein PR048_028186 [Dryococelus australis]|uniref:Carbohydrate kinase PfkB domain-containing protein n=1 Tax=Dryococelus australis TaxID=614101 RepID=A0ABQ9GIK4_9NEOP|nr:hypothetical protein PR048_028186 [Dryococelus australis]
MRVIELNIERRRNEGAGKREIPEETRRPTASSGTISTCGNPGVTRPGIEPDLIRTASNHDGNTVRLARRSDEALKRDGSTHRGLVQQSAGGVGRNLADALSKMGVSPQPLFVSAVGADANNSVVLDSLQHLVCGLVKRQGEATRREGKHRGVEPTYADQLARQWAVYSQMGLFVDHRSGMFYVYQDHKGIVVLEDERTAFYALILNSKGECLFGVGDMDIHGRLNPKLVSVARCLTVLFL